MQTTSHLIRTVAAWLLVTMTAASAAAQRPPAAEPFRVERVEQRSLRSERNGIAYKLYVALPHGYHEGTKRYPVVYLLDADYSFLIARNVADHLAERNHLHELILVGVAYAGPLQYRKNRTRDYTPMFSPRGGYGAEMQKVSGGGPKFRAFLGEELAPFVDSTYRTVPGDRTLVGHSYGGLFASWDLLSQDRLFRRYIIVSPSLWYHDRILFDLQKAHAKKMDRLPARVYLSVGGSEGDAERDMVGDLRAFAAALKSSGYAGLVIRADVLADETHNSVFPRALSNGLRFVFEGR